MNFGMPRRWRVRPRKKEVALSDWIRVSRKGRNLTISPLLPPTNDLHQ